MKTKEMIYGAVGLGVLFLGYKAFKKRQQPNLELPKSENITPIVNVEVLSTNYSKQEATAKALITVIAWIKTYDELSNEVLNQKGKNYFDSTIRFNELKAKTNRSKEEEIEMNQLTMVNVVSQNNKSLKEIIAQLKSTEYQKVYNVLKDIYAQYPKADVDKLMTILPTYLSGKMIGEDYKYSYDLEDKLSMEDKLFLSDIGFNKLFTDTFDLKYPIKVPNVINIDLNKK